MPATPRSLRPLLDTWSALGLIVATGAAFAALFPLSRDRQTRALDAAPDLLSLSYLNLALARSPDDAALRLRVAEQTLASGQFDRARELLFPLTGTGSAPDAAVLRVDVDYRAWAAVDPADARLRALALTRLTDSITAARPEALPPEQAEHVARVCAQVGARATRAAILASVARADLADDARLRAADAAALELNDPLASAQLRAERALAFPERQGAMQAALALRRALAAGQPGPALVLFRQLRPVYGQNARVLELGLSTLAGVDDVQALGVARELLELRPEDEALRARIAQLSAWTRAEPEPTPDAAPPAPSERRADPQPAPVGWELAAQSAADLASTARDRSVSNAHATSARAIERAALLESLGAPERALEVLNAALAARLVDERALWDVKVGVQLRLGQKREALATLAHMDDRFGATRASIQRRAELSLSLGELAAALELLGSAPGKPEVADERRVTAIGWELGDMARVRDAYRVIVRSPEATPDDVQRLWLLERDAGDLAQSARVALAGFERFEQVDLLKLALHTALQAGDDALVERVLAAGEKVGVRPGEDEESLRLQVSTRQARAYQALLEKQLSRADLELDRSAHLLELAKTSDPERRQLDPDRDPDRDDPFAQLRKTQQRQTLELALASGDSERLAQVYPEQAEALSARERVVVLHRLGRDEEAVDEAVTGIESGALPEVDSGALQADADALGASMPRELGVLGDVRSMQGLTAARLGAEGRLGWSGGRSLGARVELTQLRSEGGADGIFAAPLAGQSELAAELGAGIGHSRLTLGVVALDGRDPRPSLRFEQDLFEGGGLQVALAARVNERSWDTPLLRVIGVEDELSARATLAFLDRYSATLRGSAKLYSERDDRSLFGGGATVDAAVGRGWTLPAGFGANLRVAGYVAPRFDALATGPSSSGAVPDGASWVGFGAGLTRGLISVAPVAGRRVSLVADATAGWLLPLDELGWSGRLGLGVSLLGADQLSILASASNVVSTVPGFAVYTLGADYKVSSW